MYKGLLPGNDPVTVQNATLVANATTGLRLPQISLALKSLLFIISFEATSPYCNSLHFIADKLVHLQI